ncbi:hypothetical protein [uncultured Corynebacterium sp.]|uniref:hypothetical protein n=1 Tax=uncultured Corynebacterium sp. TaxID=159447 RepID=UPI00261169F1|nr:hypothetical protein [uncultured Corynebacterium sp.]
MISPNQAWLIRRSIYAIGFVAGIILVVTGKSDAETVDGWGHYLDQLAGIVTAIASGLATVKTGPASDNAPVVVPAEDVAGHAANIREATRYLTDLTQEIEKNTREVINRAPAPVTTPSSTGTPLDAALRDDSQS